MITTNSNILYTKYDLSNCEYTGTKFIKKVLGKKESEKNGIGIDNLELTKWN